MTRVLTAVRLPASASVTLPEGSTKHKLIHLLRHGETAANANAHKHHKDSAFRSAVYCDHQYFDTPLNEKGEAQTKSAADDCPRAQLVCVSPLWRTLETCQNAVPAASATPSASSTAPRVSVDERLRECSHSMEFHPCDGRDDKEVRAPQFPAHWNWENVPPGKDHIYHVVKDAVPLEVVDERIDSWVQWLSRREEQEVIVVSHSGAIRRLLWKHLKTGHDPAECKVKNAQWVSVLVEFE